jgi:predicted MFS family arabinose efflux permease
MGGFNEVETERNLFFIILLCGIGGGSAGIWAGNSLAKRLNLSDWLGTALGVLLSIALTAFLLMLYVAILLLLAIMHSKWEERNQNRSQSDASRENNQ